MSRPLDMRGITNIRYRVIAKIDADFGGKVREVFYWRETLLRTKRAVSNAVGVYFKEISNEEVY